MIDRAPAPTTRRELRLAEERAHHSQHAPVPALAAAAGAALTALTRPASPLRFSARTAAAVAVAVTAALGGAGMAQGYTSAVASTRNDAATAVVVAAAAHGAALRDRSDLAAGERLNGQAVGFAASQRAEALTAAQAAVATAQAVSTQAVADVAPDALAPLDVATASLAAMIVALPTSLPDALAAAVSSPAAQTVATTSAAPAVLTPAQPTSPTDASVPSPSAPSAAVTGATAVSPFTDPAALASDGTRPGASVLVVPTVASDLAASARMLAAAVSVTDLSDQVRATATANVEAAAAAAASVAAAMKGNQAVLKRMVTAVEGAPNGLLPVDQLCAPAFAPAALLRCDAARALDVLNAAYRAEFGTRLAITSSYRTLAEQVEIKSTRGELASTPGFSNHGRGLAVDLGGLGGVGQFTMPTYAWMKLHAESFGWHHPAIMEPGGGGPQEPWHWEFGTA